VLALEGVDVAFDPDDPVLLDVDLVVMRGERVGVVGANGAGKTALLRTLSGGERTRLAFALLMEDAPNCLLLDEPTNHLDIDSIEVLEDALEHYDGTVVAVSHDRYFLDRIADRIVLVADGAAHAYEGGWSANLARV